LNHISDISSNLDGLIISRKDAKSLCKLRRSEIFIERNIDLQYKAPAERHMYYKKHVAPLELFIYLLIFYKYSAPLELLRSLVYVFLGTI